MAQTSSSNKHAPHAPGSRPNTWWKRTYVYRHDEYAVLSLIHDEGVSYTPPPIYTRPEPRRSKGKGK